MNRPTARIIKWLAQSIALISFLSMVSIQDVQAVPALQSGTDSFLSSTVTAFSIDGPDTGQVSVPQSFVAQAFPKGAGESLTFVWTPEPLSGQSTSQATYAWDTEGKQTVKVTATTAGGKGFSADHSISIRPQVTAIPDQIEIEMLSAGPVNVGETVTLRLPIPARDLAGFTVAWTPFPNEGQGKPQATFSWNTPGEKNVHAFLIGAADTYAKAQTTVTVLDTNSNNTDSGGETGEELGSEEHEERIFLPTVLNADGGVQSAQIDELGIVGGREAEIGAWPWQVALMIYSSDPDSFICAGSLIAPNWVLTAGHCVNWWLWFSNLDAVLGRHQLSTEEGEVLQVSQIIQHPDYNRRTGDSDLALLRLNGSSVASPISLETPSYTPGDIATVIGWGYTIEDNELSASDVLMQVDVPMVSDEQCRVGYGSSLLDTMICAGQAGADACSGDSGGPLMLADETTAWTQVGVVSGGYGCAREGYPGVYTNIALFLPWIQEQMATELQTDDYEPDDSAAEANQIAVDGSMQDHSFHLLTDEDWFWFDAVAGSTYTIETLNLSEALNMQSMISDNGGHYLESDDDTWNSSGTSVEWKATYSGRHYLTVRTITTSGNLDILYSLRVTRDIFADTSGLHEPNNTPVQATELLVDAAPQTHSFHIPGDEDWAKFIAIAGVEYRIETSNLAGDSDTVLYLVDAAGSQLIRDDDGSTGLASRINWLANTDGPVYIRARHFDPDIFGDEVNYDLSVTIRPADNPLPAFEPNNSFEQATPIGTDGVAQTHDFYVSADEDWLRFSVEEGVSYVIETFNLGPKSQTTVQLYQDVNTLATDIVDLEGGPASKVIWTATVSGEVSLRVHHYFVGASGPDTHYDIRILTGGITPISPPEPNDVMAQATPIQIDMPLADDFHNANDVDWWRFEAIADATYVIETHAQGANSDTVVHLYDANGNNVASDDDGGAGYASRLEWTAVAPGTAYVHVSQYDQADGPATQYELTVTGATVPADVYEPDDSIESARNLLVDAGPQVHSFHQPGDVDWVRIEVEEGTDYVVETLNPAEGSDTILVLVDAAGQELAQNDDGGVNGGSQIQWQSPSAATLYAGVRHFDVNASGAATSYELQVRRQVSGQPDAFETDNELAEARSIAVGSTPQTHTLHTAGDVDWIRFEAAKDVNYRIETLNLGSNSDTVLSVVDVNGTVLLQDDDGGGVLASSALLTADYSGPHFVNVRHYSPNSFGADTQYDLSVTQQGIDRHSDSFEPDNERSQAAPYVVDDPAQLHNFHEPGDNDWIQFDAEVDVTYTVSTTAVDPSSSVAIYLYDGQGNLLSSIFDDDEQTIQLRWTAGDTDSYFVRTVADLNQASDADTAYELAIMTSKIQADDYEIDDSLSLARSLVDGEIQSHTFHLADDTDWLRFNAQSGMRYTVGRLNSGPDCNPFLRLYDNAGSFLKYPVNSDDGYEVSIVWDATYSGTHYISVAPSYRCGGENAIYDIQLTTSVPIIIEPIEIPAEEEP